VDAALEHLHLVKVPEKVTSLFDLRPAVPAAAPDFVQKFTAKICAGEGDDLPVSAMPIDGTFPTATAQWEKRNIALEIPVWDEELCIQCGKCVLVCPHSVIRAKVYDAQHLEGAPSTFKAVAARPKIAPAAPSASKSARSRARRKSSAAPSIWRRSCPSANPKPPTGISSWKFRIRTANRFP
jgi:pyruvate-ferredoxin/flavodoxin oxidoreductase